MAVRFSQLAPTVPRRIVSVEKNLQSQTCLFERYYATFCRPAIANMSLRTILRCILFCPARGGSFPRCNCKFQLNSSQPSLAACVSREGERSSFLFPSTRPLTTHTETREFGSPSGRSVLGDHFRWNRAAEIQPQPVVTYTLCRNHFHGVVAVHPVLLPPPPGVHAGHVPRLVGPPRGSDVPHDPPRQNATHAQMEPVRSLTRGGALRSANTHPVTPTARSARAWWGRAGSFRRRGGRPGGGTQRAYFAIDPMCAP